jgi:hypothetical protein
MLSRRHHTAIFIISMFMLLLLKDLLAKFIITCTVKNKLTTWLCLVEGNLSSLHDLVSFKIGHSKGSRMRCITKENAINRTSFQLVQVPTFLQNKAFTNKYMEVSHLGCAIVHQFISGFLLVDPKVHPVRHVASGIDRLSPEPSWGPMLVEHRPSHLNEGSGFPFVGAEYGPDTNQ